MSDEPVQSAPARVAFVFPGQGSQSVGMDAGLDPATFAEADDALGYALSAIVREGPVERLAQTEVTQPALLTTSIAMARMLARARPDIAPSFAAGHSLGEYGALVVAGVLDFGDAVRLVRLRGRAMQDAVPFGVGTMAAIMGLETEEVRALCEAHAEGEVVELAGHNCPGQTVIAGHVGAVDRVCEAVGSGARRLTVSAPFHCSLLRPAADALEAALADVRLHAPLFPVVQNAYADVAPDVDGIRARLVEQVVKPVRWMECVQHMKGFGAARCVEIGPGKTLAGLGKRIDRSLPVVSFADLLGGVA
ncbi:MAG: ACP S-malonyltransferase [Pseudomonadota bacterium]|nr:ACP S-malonyltransferase [Pseudomonadota bacterium]